MSERKAQILMASVIIARSTAYLFSKTLLQTMDRFTVLANRFLLAFPPAEEALRYRVAVRADADAELPVGTVQAPPADFPAPIPKGSEVVLDCTLSGAYNYPFKKVRIFNCNLEEALGLPD